MVCDFGMLWKQRDFLISSGNKIKNSPYVQNILDVKLLLAALAIIKVPELSKSDFLEAKRSHLINTSAEITTVMRSTS